MKAKSHPRCARCAYRRNQTRLAMARLRKSKLTVHPFGVRHRVLTVVRKRGVKGSVITRPKAKPAKKQLGLLSS